MHAVAEAMRAEYRAIVDAGFVPAMTYRRRPGRGFHVDSPAVSYR